MPTLLQQLWPSLLRAFTSRASMQSCAWRIPCQRMVGGQGLPGPEVWKVKVCRQGTPLYLLSPRQLSHPSSMVQGDCVPKVVPSVGVQGPSTAHLGAILHQKEGLPRAQARTGKQGKEETHL